jgi:hypothetical protein
VRGNKYVRRVVRVMLFKIEVSQWIALILLGIWRRRLAQANYEVEFDKEFEGWL